MFSFSRLLYFITGDSFTSRARSTHRHTHDNAEREKKVLKIESDFTVNNNNGPGKHQK